jgi:Flp pilus assembly protein TadD
VHRPPAVAAAIGLAALLPVLGLIPFSQQEVSTVADRYVYLAMLGPALLVAWVLQRIPSAGASVATVILAGLLAWLTAAQLQYWRDTSALVAHTLAIDPGSVHGNVMAALELGRRGQAQQAIPSFKKAIARDPEFPGLHYNLGNAYMHLNQFDNAIDEYQLAIDQGGPQVWKAMNNLGLAYVKIGRPDLAIDEFKRVLQMDPQNESARNNLQILSAGVPSR